MSLPDQKSPMPFLAVLGMSIMGIGLLILLAYPIVGIPLIFVGFIMSVLPKRE